MVQFCVLKNLPEHRPIRQFSSLEWEMLTNECMRKHCSFQLNSSRLIPLKVIQLISIEVYISVLKHFLKCGVVCNVLIAFKRSTIRLVDSNISPISRWCFNTKMDAKTHRMFCKLEAVGHRSIICTNRFFLSTRHFILPNETLIIQILNNHLLWFSILL